MYIYINVGSCVSFDVTNSRTAYWNTSGTCTVPVKQSEVRSLLTRQQAEPLPSSIPNKWPNKQIPCSTLHPTPALELYSGFQLDPELASSS
jgi:hypothetical protein